MTTGGLIFMGVSWGVILGLSAFCMWRLATAGDRPQVRAGRE